MASVASVAATGSDDAASTGWGATVSLAPLRAVAVSSTAAGLRRSGGAPRWTRVATGRGALGVSPLAGALAGAVLGGAPRCTRVATGRGPALGAGDAADGGITGAGGGLAGGVSGNVITVSLLLCIRRQMRYPIPTRRTTNSNLRHIAVCPPFRMRGSNHSVSQCLRVS